MIKVAERAPRGDSTLFLMAKRGIVVTGGATGIGRAIADAFVSEGDLVHILDEDGDQVAEACQQAGLTATVGDVSDPHAVERLFNEAQAEMSRIDVLINNAGVSGPAAGVEEVSFEDWQRTFAVNLTGTFLCTQHAVRIMEKGSIVNIASSAGVLGYPLRSPYAASKWAMIGLTKTLAMELGDRGIRVNAICPGPVAGDRMERVIAAEATARNMEPEDVRKSYLAQVSLGKFIEPAEIADAAVFLCSPNAASITGQVLGVDGYTETLRT